MKINKIKNKEGQAIVELALVLPILLLLVFGIIEFGRIFNAELIIANATRQGARDAAVGKTSTQIISNMTSLASTLGIDSDNIAISTTGGIATAQINYSLELITPIVAPIISSSGAFYIKSSTAMRME